MNNEEKKLTDEELNELIKKLEYQSWTKNFFELSKAAHMLKYQKAEIERLTEEANVDTITHIDLCTENFSLRKQNSELKKRLHWIWAIGVDYDGCDKAESLKELIDEIVEITQMESKDFNRHYGVEVD